MTSDFLQEDASLKIEEICEDCDLSLVEIKSYVEEGIVEVEGNDVARWRFSQSSIIQIKRAVRLENDLGVNRAGAALALELMSQIDELKTQLKRFQR